MVRVMIDLIESSLQSALLENTSSLLLYQTPPCNIPKKYFSSADLYGSRKTLTFQPITSSTVFLLHRIHIYIHFLRTV